MEACCLRISASVSYERTAEEVEYLTGVKISKSVQQRLVHRQEFELPQAESIVSELSVDGGNIRVRTPEGELSSWKGYKATVLHEQGAIVASFQENEVIISWVNSQELAPIVTCLGDGHDGVWNIIKNLYLLGKEERFLTGFISWKISTKSAVLTKDYLPLEIYYGMEKLMRLFYYLVTVISSKLKTSVLI